MAQKKGVKELVAAAEAEVTTVQVGDALKLLGDEGHVFVDLRDVRELERDGMVPGAFHAPRGMLEFWVDPESPYHKDVFSSGKTFVLYCNAGMRSALAAKTLQDMGVGPVCHVAGGFTAWREAGGPTAERPPRAKKEG